MENSKDLPIRRSASDVYVGLQSSFTEKLTAEAIDSFSRYSGDWNPLHNDKDFANSRGYRRRIGHGAIQQCFISRLIGMFLPGENALIKKISTSYSSPALEGDELCFVGTVSKWNPDSAEGEVEVKVTNQDGKGISYSVVGIAMTRGSADSKRPEPKQLSPAIAGFAPLICVGGSSALFQSLRPSLAHENRPVLSAGRDSRTSDLQCDPASEDDESFNDHLIRYQPFALLHFASLPPQKSSLSELDVGLLLQNIGLHLNPVKQCARLVQKGKLTRFNRILLISSTWSRHLLPEKGYEGYGYAKSVAVSYCRDLARELSPMGVTVNVVSPSEMPLGMNVGMSERTKAILSAKSPSGRMTAPADLLGALEFLLSPQSQAVTGQEIVIAGGRS